MLLCFMRRHKRTVVRVRAERGRDDVHDDQRLRDRDVAELRMRHPSGRHRRHIQVERLRRQRTVGRQVRQAVHENPIGRSAR